MWINANHKYITNHALTTTELHLLCFEYSALFSSTFCSISILHLSVKYWYKALCHLMGIYQADLKYSSIQSMTVAIFYVSLPFLPPPWRSSSFSFWQKLYFCKIKCFLSVVSFEITLIEPHIFLNNILSTIFVGIIKNNFILTG